MQVRIKKLLGGFEHSGLFALIDKKGVTSGAGKIIMETQYSITMDWIKKGLNMQRILIFIKE
jgi:hypothetical protein